MTQQRELTPEQRAQLTRAREVMEEAARTISQSVSDPIRRMRAVFGGDEAYSEVPGRRAALDEIDEAQRALRDAGRVPRKTDPEATPLQVQRDDFERLEGQVEQLQRMVGALLEVVAKDDPELRARIAETHLMAGQMHRHFVPDPPEPGDEETAARDA